MSQVALLRWRWQPAAPLVTGYSQNLAEAAGKIERGQKQVVNLETHNHQGQLQSSFLAASVKGVFRSAAAWLVERTAREQGATSYITCDYNRDVPEHWRPEVGNCQQTRLCPVSRVFGGAGCEDENDETPTLRLKSLVNFCFNKANDAAYGSTRQSSPYRFAWERIANEGKELWVEQLRFKPETILEVRIEPANDFAIALLLLSADLVSSGFFRFGRFTSRGYGVVRLSLQDYFYGSLLSLLSQGTIPRVAVKSGLSGYQVNFKQNQQLPMEIVRDEISRTLKK